MLLPLLPFTAGAPRDMLMSCAMLLRLRYDAYADAAAAFDSVTRFADAALPLPYDVDTLMFSPLFAAC